MLVSVLYLVACRLFALVVFLARSDRSKELELLVLRHELSILRRQARRPQPTESDRLVLAALSRVVPSSSWRAFLVTPETLLRWHRRIIPRRWRPNRQQRQVTVPDVVTPFFRQTLAQQPVVDAGRANHPLEVLVGLGGGVSCGECLSESTRALGTEAAEFAFVCGYGPLVERLISRWDDAAEENPYL